MNPLPYTKKSKKERRKDVKMIFYFLGNIRKWIKQPKTKEIRIHQSTSEDVKVGGATAAAASDKHDWHFHHRRRHHSLQPLSPPPLSLSSFFLPSKILLLQPHFLFLCLTFLLLVPLPFFHCSGPPKFSSRCFLLISFVRLDLGAPSFRFPPFISRYPHLNISYSFSSLFFYPFFSLNAYWVRELDIFFYFPKSKELNPIER